MEQVSTGTVAVVSPSVGVTEVLGEHVNNTPNPSAAGWTFHVPTDDGGTEAWVVPALQNRVKGQFEQWVREQAQLLIALTAMTNRDEADRLRSRMVADFTAGKYNWEEEDAALEAGDIIRASVYSLNGGQHLLWLLLRQIDKQKDVTPKRVRQLFVKAPQACVDAYKWAMGNLEAQEPGQTNGSSAKA